MRAWSGDKDDVMGPTVPHSLEKAKKKLKLSEVTSDLQTDAEIEGYRPKRKALATKRCLSSDDNDDPPILKKNFSKYVEQIQINRRELESECEINIDTELVNSPSSKTQSGKFNKFNLAEPEISSEFNTPTSKHNKIQLTEFEEKVIQLLANIKAQNELMISLLKKDVIHDTAGLKLNIKFPLETALDMNEIEIYLETEDNSKQLIRYLGSLGGRDVATKLYRVLRFVMTDMLAVQYNFYGKRSAKRPFRDLKLNAVVIGTESAKANTPPLKNGNDLVESGYLIAVGSRTSRFRRKHRDNIRVIILLGLLTFLLIFAIIMTVLYAIQKHHKPVRICDSKECLRSAANLALSMDLTVDPCHDFYEYACGNWPEDHPRPDSYLSYDWFRAKQMKVYSLVREFLSKNTTDNPRAVTDARNMFYACMDTGTIDKRGLKPIFSVLSKLGLPPFPTLINVTDVDYSTYTFDWLETVIKVKTQIGMDVIIGFDIFADPRNSSAYTLAMGTPETTNPFPSLQYKRKGHGHDRIHRPRHKRKQSILQDKYYMVDNIDDDEYNNVFAELMKILVGRSGEFKHSKLTETELDENILATKDVYVSIKDDIYQLENDNSTDAYDDYQKIPRYTVEQLQNITDLTVEHYNATATPIWRRYLEGIFNISDVSLDFEKDKILISQPDLQYLVTIAAYVAKMPPAVLELYIWIKVVEVMAVHTTSELRDLFEKAHQTETMQHYSGSRSLQCANAVNDMLGMAVSYGIADPHFFNSTKPKIEIMINELKNALAHLVGLAKWMDDDTKLATYQKIIQMKSLIGFPDWLLEEGMLDEYYNEIKIQRDTHLENLINVIQRFVKRSLNKLHASHNVSWATEPTEVNAYHTFQHNTITVPLVVLQYPFFDLGIDSLNYGSLGTVLGHEITHGFDNFGRYFDKNGNALPWWSNETIESFENKTKCFIDQYSSFYLPQVDDHVDGKKTLGENIADNGGVREALAALRNHLKKTGPEKKLPGFEKFSSEQMFFLSYGNLWCGVSTLESVRSDLEDEHAPQKLRVTGTLQNEAAFARAWKCRPGSHMNPKKKCIIY